MFCETFWATEKLVLDNDERSRCKHVFNFLQLLLCPVIAKRKILSRPLWKMRFCSWGKEVTLCLLSQKNAVPGLITSRLNNPTGGTKIWDSELTREVNEWRGYVSRETVVLRRWRIQQNNLAANMFWIQIDSIQLPVSSAELKMKIGYRKEVHSWRSER